MTAALRYDSAKLQDKGWLHLDAQLGPADFGDVMGVVGRLNGMQDVSLDLSIEAHRIAFRGKVSGKWQLECSRCVASPIVDWEAPLEGMLEGPSIPEQLFEEVRQALALSVPSRIFCKPDCKGLCQKCGANLNEKECGCNFKPS